MFGESFQGQYKDGTNGRPTRDFGILIFVYFTGVCIRLYFRNNIDYWNLVSVQILSVGLLL